MYGVLRVSGLPHSDKIKYINSEDATVAHVVSIREEAPTAAEAEAAASAAAAAASTAEPEVAKKGGKTEDAAKKPEAGAKKSDSGSGAKK
jgi:large subunit ribosomal protein L25